MRSLIPYFIGAALGCSAKPVETPRRETTPVETPRRETTDTHRVTLNGIEYTMQDCDKDGIVDLVRYGTEHDARLTFTGTAYVRKGADLRKLRCYGGRVDEVIPMSSGIGLAANRAHFALDDLYLAVRQAEFKLSSGENKK